MKNPKIGQAVTWGTGGPNSVRLTGHVEAINGDRAHVRSNGSLHDVCIDRMRPALICVMCGEPTKAGARYYCSESCRSADIAASTDDIVLETIIKFKAENDGCPPSRLTVAKISGVAEPTVNRSVKRLVAAGRLKVIGYRLHQGFVVPGGRWVYEEPKP